jgi:hypothetical protein
VGDDGEGADGNVHDLHVVFWLLRMQNNILYMM